MGNRNRRAARRKLRSDAVQAAAATEPKPPQRRVVLDMLSNAASGIGGAQDKDLYNQIVTSVPLALDQLNELYTGSWMCRRVIDLPASELTREGWRSLVAGDPRASDVYDKEHRRLGLKWKVREAKKWAYLYGGSALVVYAKDRRPLAQPLQLSAIQEIGDIVVATAPELVPDTWANAYEVETYRFTPRGRGGWTGATSEIIHASRVWEFKGAGVPPGVTTSFYGWDSSLLQAVWQTFMQFDTTHTVMHNIVQEFKIAVYKISGSDAIYSADDGTNKLFQRLQNLNLYKSFINAITIDKDFEDFEFRNPSVTGLPDLYDRFAQSCSAASGIPITLLFGQAPSGLSTDDQSGRRYFYDKTRAEQVDEVEPCLDWVNELIWRAKKGPFSGKDPGGVKIHFNNLERPTEAEMVEMRNKQAQTDKTYFDIGMDASVIIQNRFGGESYSFETVLPDENVEAAMREEVEALYQGMKPQSTEQDPGDSKEGRQENAEP